MGAAPLEQAEGVIVRMHPFSDTSLILHWITAEHGRFGTLARGIRKPKSGHAAPVDLLFTGTLGFVRSSRSHLHTFREFVPVERHERLRTDYGKLVQVAYAVALLERATEEDTPIPEFYALFRSWLSALSAQPGQPRMVLAFEARLLVEMGLDPRGAESVDRSGVGDVLGHLIEADWAELPGLSPSRTAARNLVSILQRQLVEALGTVPRSRADALSSDAASRVES
ncbi:MAG: DNA repair protein RecO [Limisphaerales bacterium]